MNTSAWKPVSSTQARSASLEYSLPETVASWKWLLLMLWLVSVFRMIDLQVIGVLLEPIRLEFGFTDTQLGLISGLSFALVYSLLGLPIAWLADRTSRTRIIAWALAFWSLMTMLCGFAGGFVSFFLARMGVGIGEAGGYGPTVSLLYDRVSEGNRNRAFAILGSAVPAGVFISFLVGALLLEHIGWRGIYVAIGLPGIFLAMLMGLTLSDNRKITRIPAQVLPSPALLFSSIAVLLKQARMRLILTASTFCMLGATASGIWMPSFYMRVHGLDVTATGISMALIYGGGGIAGTLLGGWMGDKAGPENMGRLTKWCSLCVIGVLPLALLVLFVDDTMTSLAALLLMVLVMHLTVGPLLSLVQACSTDESRALSQSLNVLFSTLFGLGLGALTVGFISDRLAPLAGVSALPIAMFMVMQVGFSSAGLAFWNAGKHSDTEYGV